jgi:hypothetical protein
MTGRVRRLVEIYNTRADIRFEIPFEGCAAIGNGCKVTSANKYYNSLLVLSSNNCSLAYTIVIVLEQQRP